MQSGYDVELPGGLPSNEYGRLDTEGYRSIKTHLKNSERRPSNVIYWNRQSAQARRIGRKTIMMMMTYNEPETPQ